MLSSLGSKLDLTQLGLSKFAPQRENSPVKLSAITTVSQTGKGSFTNDVITFCSILPHPSPRAYVIISSCNHFLLDFPYFILKIIFFLRHQFLLNFFPNYKCSIFDFLLNDQHKQIVIRIKNNILFKNNE